MKNTVPDVWHGRHGRYPARITALAVLAGCLVGRADASPVVWFVLLTLSVTVALVSIQWSYPSRTVVLLALALMFLTIVRGQSHIRQYHNNCILRMFYPSLTDPIPDPVRIIGKVTDFPAINPDFTRFTIRVEQIHWRRKTLSCDGRIWVAVQTPAETRPGPFPTAAYPPGTELEILGYWQPILTFMNPGSDHRPESFLVHRIHGRLRVKQPELIVRRKPTRNVLLRWLFQYRRSILTRLQTMQKDRPVPYLFGILRALWLGERQDIPTTLHARLEHAGLLHLLAVSGLHVGLLAFFLWVVLYRWLLLPRHLSYTLFLFFLFLYVVMIGAPISAVRAAALIGLYTLGRWIFLPVDPLNLLAAVFTIALLWNPLYIRDIGFQLTFGLTAILLLSVRHLIPQRQPHRRWIAPIALSFTAWCASLPWLFSVFGIVPLTSVLWNLVFWPLVTLLVTLSLFLPLLLLLPPFLAFSPRIFAGLEWLLRIWVEHSHALMPSITVPVHPYPALIATCLILFLLIMTPKLRTLPKRWLLWSGSVTLLILWAGSPLASKMTGTPPNDELILLDVAQGESIILRSGDHALVIDGGGLQGRPWDIGRWVVKPALLHLGIRVVNPVIMTHPHPDHYTGLTALIRSFHSRQFFYPFNTWIPKWIQKDPAFPRVRTGTFTEGDTFTWKGWSFRVLNPPPHFKQSRATLNNGSLTLLAQKGPHRILLTGDIETLTEQRLVETYGPALHADVLKLAHHGSRPSTTPAFLRNVHPRLAVCSAGRRNRYGVPHPDVLKRLRSAGVFVLCTNHEGQIRIRFHPDGRLSFWTYRSSQWHILPPIR